MQHLKFALVVGAFIFTALPVYAAEGAPGENAGAATAGHLITPKELQKACGPLISDARAQRVAYFEEYIRVIGSSKETKQLLARARDKTIPDAKWYINWSHLGPGFTGMLDDNSWLNEGRDSQSFRKVIARLSGSFNAEQKDPQTLAGICAMRAHVAALEGAEANHLSPANGNQTSAHRDTPVKPVAAVPVGSPPNATGPLDPYDSAVRADLEYACAEEIKLAESTSPGTAWFNSSWASQFKQSQYRPPSLAFDRIRKETRPQWIPFHYLDACAAVAYIVQFRSGVGSGKEALAVWQKLRADYEPLLSAGRASTNTAVPSEHDQRCEIRPGCAKIVDGRQERCRDGKDNFGTYTGGSCPNGLLEGIVKYRFGGNGDRNTYFNLYQQGKELISARISSGPSIPSGTHYSVFKFHGAVYVYGTCEGASASARVKSDPLCEEAARIFGIDVFEKNEAARDAGLEEMNAAFGGSRK